MPIARQLGMVTYLVVNGISRRSGRRLGEPRRACERKPGREKAGCVVPCIWKVSDAAFSRQRHRALRSTTDPIIIARGVVGAMFVGRSDLMVATGLDRYVYLEHGAHWAMRLAIIFIVHRPPIRRPQWNHPLRWWILSGRRSAKVCGAQSPNSQVHEVRIAAGGGAKREGGRPKPKSVCTGP